MQTYKELIKVYYVDTMIRSQNNDVNKLIKQRYFLRLENLYFSVIRSENNDVIIIRKLRYFQLYNNLKNSCDFIGREPWSIRVMIY
jgi:hypothetical protein